MAINIYFRGAALFVARGGVVTEVLFPSAESRKPKDGESKPYEEDGEVVATLMKHADGTPAARHYAGAMILGPGVTATYRKLTGRLIRASVPGSGAEPKDGLLSQIPPIAKVTTNPKSQLKLRTPADPDYFASIATRFVIGGGEMYVDSPSNYDWLLAGGKHGGDVLLKGCPLAVRWTFPNVDQLELDVRSIDDAQRVEAPIVLGADQSTAYLYHFDIALPTEHQLKAENPPKKKAIDHDFKWLYELFIPVNQKNWHDWLDHGKFPAPQCTDSGLVSVSTCFPGLWDG